jgi:hypothetical protein
MKDRALIKKRIIEDEDFIYCPRLCNSLKKMVDKHPNGVEDGKIQKVLMLSLEEVVEHYNNALIKLRKILVDKEENT